MCFMLSHLFIAALWSPAGKVLTSWLLFVVFNCVFVTFPSGILGQMWYLIVSIPDLCLISYFEAKPISKCTTWNKKEMAIAGLIRKLHAV